MKIYIDTDKLTDAPFDEKSSFPFSFDDSFIEEIVEDIVCGNPTCYLVSGYRGAGKSSFVRRVEFIARKKKNVPLFIHLNFAKYKSQDFLLRKLIRAIYQALMEDRNKFIYDNLKNTEENEDNEKKTDTLLRRLYDQTFHEVVYSQHQIDEKTKTKSLEFNYLLFGIFLLTSLVSIGNYFKLWVDINKVLSIITFATSFIGALGAAFSLRYKKERKKSFSEEFERKSLYDDEISDFHFNTLLDKFSKNKIKLVFALDELDKVKSKEIPALINEMKPYLVSGKASFIVIAGQGLFYRYKSAQMEDDKVISTLFSRIIHVPLPSIDSLRNLFDGLIDKTKPGNPTSAEYQFFLDFLIFESKRIPRRFVNLIREKIAWNDGRSIGFDKDNPEHKRASVIINAIMKIDNDEVAINFEDGARDYIIMQLFLKADSMLRKRLGNQTFILEDLFNKKSAIKENEKSEE